MGRYLLDTYGASRMGIAAYLVQIILVVPIYTVICSRRCVSLPLLMGTWVTWVAMGP